MKDLFFPAVFGAAATLLIIAVVEAIIPPRPPWAPHATTTNQHAALPVPVDLGLASEDSWDHFNTNAWLRVMRINRCPDGQFEVKTAMTVMAKTRTLEETMEAAYAWSLRLVASAKSDDSNFNSLAVPDCGERIR